MGESDILQREIQDDRLHKEFLALGYHLYNESAEPIELDSLHTTITELSDLLKKKI